MSLLSAWNTLSREPSTELPLLVRQAVELLDGFGSSLSSLEDNIGVAAQTARSLVERELKVHHLGRLGAHPAAQPSRYIAGSVLAMDVSDKDLPRLGTDVLAVVVAFVMPARGWLALFAVGCMLTTARWLESRGFGRVALSRRARGASIVLVRGLAMTVCSAVVTRA